MLQHIGSHFFRWFFSPEKLRWQWNKTAMNESMYLLGDFLHGSLKLRVSI